MMDGSVIVPLYVYPSSGAWEPVYSMASLYPQVQFTAVVNIQSGPGEGALPNAEYTQAIGTLNQFTNVRTIGYVSTTWCERNLSSVLEDVSAYSFWGEYDSRLALDGIFVDETPTKFSPDYVSYLQTIAQAVHGSRGLMDSYIVHNPGVLPDIRYFDIVTPEGDELIGPDLTVVYENSFSNWSRDFEQLAQNTDGYDREKLALVLHSVPSLGIAATTITLTELLAVGHSVWLTGSNNYTMFDGILPLLIECLAALVIGVGII